jgi:heme exporter protein A
MDSARALRDKRVMEIVADSLACRRAGRRVFSGVSFRVRSGEAAILRGPNGSGKSSLLRLLAGFIPPESGDATLDGRSLRRDRDAAQERVAYAGHLDAVKPQLTVAENLEVWAALFGAGSGAVCRALGAFGLDRLADTPAAYCSAGQKRRLGLARLLTAERPIWLLDEPTVSLDVAATERFAALVRAHCAEGGLAIAATHVPLGLEGGPVIALEDAPAAAVAEAEADPFLEGAW